jgi:hypothetical protein
MCYVMRGVYDNACSSIFYSNYMGKAFKERITAAILYKQEQPRG